MKTAALKFLAVGGVVLAAYPVVTTLKPDSPASPSLPEIIRPNNTSNIVVPEKHPGTETALSLSPAVPSAGSFANSVTLKPDPSGHFIAKAMINGFPVQLMFDTGASIVALSYEDAVRLGFRLNSADFKSHIQTANGLAPAAELVLKEVRLDGIIIADVPAMILPPGKLEMSLLGRSFWGRLKTGFSYAAGNLILKN